jgi:hypothetical protein
MEQNPAEAAWLANGKRNLTRMRDEISLTDAEIAIVERGIAAFNRLAAKLSEERPAQSSLTVRLSKRQPADGA